MMKKLTILIFVAGLGFAAQAQQIPQYSQYMVNDYILNPAITGMHDYFEVKSNNRIQWVGINDAPRTFLLSVHGPFSKYNMGLVVLSSGCYRTNQSNGCLLELRLPPQALQLLEVGHGIKRRIAAIPDR